MRKIFFIFISCAVGLFTGVKNLAFGEVIISELYKVSCIIFSIGLGYIISFSYTGIKNMDFIRNVRRVVNRVRDDFITIFTICSIFYVTSLYITNAMLLDMNLSCVIKNSTSILLFISILFYIFNYLHIQKLKEDITDKLIREEYEKFKEERERVRNS